MSAKRFFVVVNPRGGTRKAGAILDRVRPIFDRAGAELVVAQTRGPGHAGEIARTLDLGPYDGFCTIGGDGIVHEVADGLMRRGEPVPIPLGLIPAGSGNALSLHLGCADPIEAARRIVAGTAIPLDVARVVIEDRIVYCVNIVGWGAVADINVAAERLRWLGPSRYAAAALWHVLRARRRAARLVLDGRSEDDAFFFLAACNTKYTGRGMRLAPRAEIDDGLIDVVLLRRASRAEMLRLFGRIFDGSHVAMDCVEYAQVRSLAIESDDPQRLNLDGEVAGGVSLRLEMIPGALRVFAPQ